MKEFMTKIVNVWKAWSIRTKSVVVVTLALIIFVVAGVFSTSPTPSPRFSVPYTVEEEVRRGGEYALLGTVRSNPDGKVFVRVEDTNNREALVPAFMVASDDLYYKAIKEDFDSGRKILYGYQVTHLHSQVMQLNTVLSELLSSSDLKNHKIDYYMVIIRNNYVSVLLGYKDKCAMMIDYDYNKDAYKGVDINEKSNPSHHNDNVKILKYLNDNLDKRNN